VGTTVALPATLRGACERAGHAGPCARVTVPRVGLAAEAALAGGSGARLRARTSAAQSSRRASGAPARTRGARRRLCSARLYVREARLRARTRAAQPQLMWRSWTRGWQSGERRHCAARQDPPATLGVRLRSPAGITRVCLTCVRAAGARPARRSQVLSCGVGGAPPRRSSALAGKNAVSAATLADGYCAVLSYVREARPRARTSAAAPADELPSGLPRPAQESAAEAGAARSVARAARRWAAASSDPRYVARVGGVRWGERERRRTRALASAAPGRTLGARLLRLPAGCRRVAAPPRARCRGPRSDRPRNSASRTAIARLRQWTSVALEPRGGGNSASGAPVRTLAKKRGERGCDGRPVARRPGPVRALPRPAQGSAAEAALCG
jgi:hypothetical protein